MLHRIELTGLVKARPGSADTVSVTSKCQSHDPALSTNDLHGDVAAPEHTDHVSTPLARASDSHLKFPRAAAMSLLLVSALTVAITLSKSTSIDVLCAVSILINGYALLRLPHMIDGRLRYINRCNTTT